MITNSKHRTPKRVLLATDVTSRGGVDNYILNLSRVAWKAGWEVDILIEKTSKCEILKTLLPHEIKIHSARIYHRIYDNVTIKNENSHFNTIVTNPDGTSFS